MKTVSLIFVLLLGGTFTSNALSLEVIRTNYQLAVKDKNICSSMIQQLENNPESNVHLAYLGAFQTIWANHIFNPISKLSTFNTGKKNIDKAVNLSPNDVEIIFIRHSVQKNCPKFLGYNVNCEEDEKFLSKNLNSISSVALKNMVEKLLKS
jgi:hypothetical protein